jgi:hypothetical protein
MSNPKMADLVLFVASKKTGSWVLEPKGRSSFRIVVMAKKDPDPNDRLVNLWR